MDSEKEDYSSAMAFNESWIEFYLKSIVRIESSNTSSVTKNSLEITTCKKIAEKICSNLIKFFENDYSKL